MLWGNVAAGTGAPVPDPRGAVLFPCLADPPNAAPNSTFKRLDMTPRRAPVAAAGSAFGTYSAVIASEKNRAPEREGAEIDVHDEAGELDEAGPRQPKTLGAQMAVKIATDRT